MSLPKDFDRDDAHRNSGVKPCPQTTAGNASYPAHARLVYALHLEATMNDILHRITIDPEICNGKPTIRSKRITVQTILEFLTAGESREEILRQFPFLEAEDIEACLAFATTLMSRHYVIQVPA